MESNMKRRHSVRVLAVLAVLALAASCGGRDDDSDSTGGGGGGGGESGDSALIDTTDCPDTQTAGLEGDTIKLVSSFPQSGLTAAFSQISRGYKSYFEMVNEEGGVEVGGKKYKIEIEDKDDEYNPGKTATNIEELVGSEGDKAFAVFNVIGTANNLAIRDLLGELCVPNVFVGTGSPAWANTDDFPWLLGSTTISYALEAQAFANLLKEQKPDAKVAMLLQDDDFGKGYEDSFKAAIKDTDIEVVATERYAPGAQEVGSQITSLASSDADAFFNGGTLLACPAALTAVSQTDWKPITYVSGTCISKSLMGLAGPAAEDVYSVGNVMDPFDPQWAEEDEMKLYREQVAKYQPEADLDNGIVAYGWTQGALLVEALKAVDGDLTRLSLMESVRNMDGVEAGLLLPDISVTTGPDDPFLAETVQLVQYDSAKKYFDLIGDHISFEGELTDVTPEDLIKG
jgi:branched-chain amino acid transport system substrate-binding protein